MSKCLIAEYDTIAEAKLGLEVLESHDFTLKNISVVSSASDPAAEHLHDLHAEGQHRSNDSTSEGHNVSLGMLIGGSVAAPIAAGTLVGPFIIAGPLVGMAVGAVVGSLLSSTEKWGVHRELSSDYEQRVESGSVLIIVNDDDATRLNDAAALLQATEPKSLERFEVS